MGPLLMLVGRFCNGMVALFCCFREYGCWRAWRTMVLSVRWKPLPFSAVHAWLVWCWLACVWSVYGRAVGSPALLSVHGCVNLLTGGLFVVASFALKLALAEPDLVRVVVMSVSLLVCCASVDLRSTRPVGAPVVQGRTVDDLFWVGFLVQRPACAQPLGLSSRCLRLVVANLLGVGWLCCNRVVPSALC